MKRVVVIVVVVVLVVGVAAAALAVLGVQARDPSGQAGPARRVDVPAAPEAGAAVPPRPTLARFYAQRLSWSDCQDGFQCARLTVPLDYTEARGETLELALLKVPAEQPAERVGSLVVNPGGPGAPGTQYAAQADVVFGQALRDRFDIVGFDPRGTGDSSPVDCLSDRQLDAYVAMDPSPDTPAEVRTYDGFVSTLGRGCLARSGDLAAHVSTVEAARDMDVLRAALGESTMDYFGASYGTKLGATYADLFPDRVGRLVLDGAVDLSIDSRELSLEQAAGFETALRSYVANCVDETPSCFLGGSVDQGLARIKAFLGTVDDQPLTTSSGRELDVGNAFYGIVAPLYNRDYWYILSAALKQGLAGDGSSLLLLSDAYSSRDSGGGYADNSAEAIYAISCLDDAYAIDSSQVPDQLPDFEKASPTFGEVFAWGLTTCHGVRARTTEEPRTVRAAGAAPILVVGTTRDPATPYQWAQHLADQLESGVLVSRDGDGHTGYHAGNACVDDAVESYLVVGTVPEDGLSC